MMGLTADAAHLVAERPVRAFCAQHGIAYRDSGFFASYAQVLRHLHTVGSLRPEPEY
jgi:hypothetical protein